MNSLAEFRKKIYNKQDKNGYTILHKDILFNRGKNIMQYLKLGCCPNIQDKFGNTALHYAAFCLYPERSFELMKLVVKTDNITNVYGLTAKDLANYRTFKNFLNIFNLSGWEKVKLNQGKMNGLFFAISCSPKNIRDYVFLYKTKYIGYTPFDWAFREDNFETLKIMSKLFLKDDYEDQNNLVDFAVFYSNFYFLNYLFDNELVNPFKITNTQIKDIVCEKRKQYIKKRIKNLYEVDILYKDVIFYIVSFLFKLDYKEFTNLFFESIN